MKVLVTGAGGMTGAELVRQAREKGWDVAAYTKADLDVTDAGAVDDAIGRERPNVDLQCRRVHRGRRRRELTRDGDGG